MAPNHDNGPAPMTVEEFLYGKPVNRKERRAKDKADRLEDKKAKKFFKGVKVAS